MGRAIGRSRMEPATIGCNELVRLWRAPTPAPVGGGPMVPVQDRLYHRPGGFYSIFTGKQGSVACQRVSQQPRIGRLLPRHFIGQLQLALPSNKGLARL